MRKGMTSPDGSGGAAEPLRIAAPEEAGEIRDLYRRAFAADARMLGYRPGPMDTDYEVLFKQNFVLALGEPTRISGAVVTAPRRGYLYIEAIAVAPGARAKGRGRFLLDGVEALASDLCLSQVRLHTVPVLLDAMRFYSACGYREVNRTGDTAQSRSLFVKDVMTALDLLIDAPVEPQRR